MAFAVRRSHVFDPVVATHVLKTVFGHGGFRGQQGDAVRAIIEGRDVLYISATGSGKSLVYQLPTQYLRATSRRAERSTSLVISPLLSLMEDQAMAMRAVGISVIALHGETPNASAEWDKAMTGAYDLVFTTPESCISRLPAIQSLHRRGMLDLLAIDEAHTVSEWCVRRST